MMRTHVNSESGIGGHRRAVVVVVGPALLAMAAGVIQTAAKASGRPGPTIPRPSATHERR